MKTLLFTALALAAAPAMAATCGENLDAKARRQIDAGSVSLAYAAQPSPIPVDRHFKLAIAVCGAPVTALRVDADMPAHRHGMNYRTTVQSLGGGRWRADGLMFHMPGRWRFLFELDRAGQPPLRLTQDLDLP